MTPERDSGSAAGSPAGLPEPAAPALSTGAVARRLGVSPTTLRSWDRRYGLGPEVRPDGRHRRWSARDLAVLEEMCRPTAAGAPPAEAARAAGEWAAARDAAPERGAPAPGAGEPTAGEPGGRVPGPRAGRTERTRPTRAGSHPADPGPAARTPAPRTSACEDPARAARRGLARAAIRLDAPSVHVQVGALIARYGLTRAWEEVLVPTLRAVGRKWETPGDRYVAVEDLLSWHVSTALRQATVPRRPPPPSRPCCSPACPANSTPSRSKRSTPRCARPACPPGCSARPSPPLCFLWSCKRAAGLRARHGCSPLSNR